ncbi:MAG: hypothetical protein MSG64_10270 [Pyrinomonadaceae bacterium MAG19_C2-C3]|nr:hypothetical protein [Pyrinomonadaceae bacterium MAG19_C2-C3]
MSANVTSVVEAVRHLTPAEQREILARLLPQQAAHDGSTVWMSVKFSDAARVVAYTSEQEPLLAELSQVLRQGVLARLENKEDGIYELYGTDRTYLVVMTPAREFAALLSSWTPDDPPREITFPNE